MGGQRHDQADQQRRRGEARGHWSQFQAGELQYDLELQLRRGKSQALLLRPKGAKAERDYGEARQEDASLQIGTLPFQVRASPPEFQHVRQDFHD